MIQKRVAIFCVCSMLVISIAHAQTKVLLVGQEPDHPYGTHMYMHTNEVLAKCLALNGKIESVVSDSWPKNEKMLERVDAIVVYSSPAAELLLDGPQRNQVDVLINAGVGLVTIHWASSVKQEDFDRLGPKWLSYLGGTWISNVGLELGESALVQLQPDHPISRGWKEYWIHDEFYLNPTITDEATPLLQATSNEKPVVVGWAYDRPDGGRSFATTLGHFYENFQRVDFRRMIVNAILWSAHVEIHPSGARVDLSQEDLALLPELTP
ncbi:ThuA domain-containing protein [Bythopirellula polymerisocia]|uniref:Trehalose utilization n=1 Tax=Bythopirellula polymerisocia TaxID=2528003 RepID=A0A5C6C9H6_9BACT|nr:ThuA domain-containing protein [Bythopirellula polymerisocia]TWU21373.1 Trehalose utilization [Bythopirellula polymerisocia]